MATLNTVEYNQATRQMFPSNLTSSYALTASYASGSIPSSISSSYALTSSFALNGGGGGVSLNTVSSSFYIIPVQSAKLLTTQSAVLNNGAVCWELLFNQGQSATWQLPMPTGYLSSSLSTTIQWYATGSVTGAKQVLWDFWLTSISPGSSTVVTQSTPNLAVLGVTASFAQSGSWLQSTKVWLTGSAITSSNFLIYTLDRNTGSADTAIGPIAVVSAILEWLKY